MDKTQIFTALSLIINLLIVAFMVKSIIGFFTMGGKGNMKVRSFVAFRYFTVQSNALMAAASAVMVGFDIAMLAGGEPGPYWALAFTHAATTAVMLTFTVVFCIFVPTTGVRFMIEGDSLYMHLISPLLAMIAFIVFDPGLAVSWISILWGMIPTALYAVLYYIKVMVHGPERGGWDDFYKFNANGRWLLMAVCIFLMTAGLGALLILGRNALCPVLTAM